MSRGPSTFRKRDITRAVAAVRDAGVEVARVEIEKGKISVITGKPDETSTIGSNANDLDKWMREHARPSQGN
jgi:hypothetical protein